MPSKQTAVMSLGGADEIKLGSFARSSFWSTLSSDTAIVIVLLLVCFFCYANSLGNSFVYDDEQQILQNPYVKNWHYLPQIFGSTVWSFVGQAGTTNYYRPLMTFSFLVLWQIFGSIPFGYHLFNIVLHAGVVLLVFYVGRKLFQDRRIGWLSALLFAVHPVHTETVDWIAAVPDLELTVFFLVCTWLLAEREVFGWRRRIGLLISFLLALLSKEPALMFLPVAVVYEHRVSLDRQTTSLAEKVSRYAPLCVLGVAYVLLRVVLFGKIAPVLQRPKLGWTDSVYSAFALIVDYTRLLLWPVRLSAFHAFHPHFSLADPTVILGIAIFLASILVMVKLFKNAPIAGLSLLWMGATLAPVLNARWMASNVLAERYLYLPSVGFCWLVGCYGVKSWDILSHYRWHGRHVRVVMATALCAVATLAAAKTITRNRDWRDDFTLYTRTLASDPDAHVIRHNLAGIYFSRGDLKHAGQEWELVLVQKPDSVNTMNALGILYTEEGRYSEAAAMFHRAIQAKPLWADPHYNYGLLLRKAGDSDQALEELKTAVAVAPLNPTARHWYADALSDHEQYAKSEEQYKASLSLDPNPPLETYKGLVSVYLRENKTSLAETALRDILARFPYDSTSHLQLAAILETAGQKDEALKEYQAGLSMDPANKEAKAALKRLRQISEQR